MNFRRIDNDTVQCLLTEEEMNAYGFRIEEFFSDQKKAREFLEHLIERAEEEIGYEVKGGLISMQVMKTPDNDLLITFSDKDANEGFQSILEHLHQQLTNLVDPDMLPGLHNESADDIMDIGLPDFDVFGDEDTYVDEQKQPNSQKKQKDKDTAARVYRFESFQAVEQYINVVDISKKITSSLFYREEDEEYYLLVKKGKLKAEEYQNVCNQLGEFAVLFSMRPYAEQFCKEHFETVIAKQAVKTLKRIETGKY